jgi:Na+-translocating ferredoxin:NAD+ oxidoreductase subunit B
VRDNLPSGFPATENGVEIRLLKKIFDPAEAKLFCRLKLNFETPERISERTGHSAAELVHKLEIMKNKGQIFGIDVNGVKFYRMLPWAFGVYELQAPRMDREMAIMFQEYAEAFSKQFFSTAPPLMQVIPIEKEIPGQQQVLSYERVSSIIKNSRSFMYFDCICKKEKQLLGKPCNRPVQVCTAYAPIAGIFDNHPFGTAMTRQEAYDLLSRAEAQSLVHLTWNVQNGHYFICNCCGCCCRVLNSIKELGFPSSYVLNSYYYAVIDPDTCSACGICAKERCQVNAIVQEGGKYRVTTKQCIGCGLCVSTCPEKAVSLMRKPEDEIKTPPENEIQWHIARAKMRGVDISEFI